MSVSGVRQRDGKPVLYGRDGHLAAIDRLLEGMRSGRAGALVLVGEAGVGKTTLLDAAEEKAAGARVVRVTGVESEAELPFAGLHALLRPALDEIGTLPERQAAALRGAFGMAKAVVADRTGARDAGRGRFFPPAGPGSGPGGLGCRRTDSSAPGAGRRAGP